VARSSELPDIFVCKTPMPNLEKYGHYELKLMYALKLSVALTILLPTDKVHCNIMMLKIVSFK